CAPACAPACASARVVASACASARVVVGDAPASLPPILILVCCASAGLAPWRDARRRLQPVLSRVLGRIATAGMPPARDACRVPCAPYCPFVSLLALAPGVLVVSVAGLAVFD